MGVAPGCARQFTPGGRPRRGAVRGLVGSDSMCACGPSFDLSSTPLTAATFGCLVMGRGR